jgi:hypothetical protein
LLKKKKEITFAGRLATDFIPLSFRAFFMNHYMTSFTYATNLVGTYHVMIAFGSVLGSQCWEHSFLYRVEPKKWKSCVMNRFFFFFFNRQFRGNEAKRAITISMDASFQKLTSVLPRLICFLWITHEMFVDHVGWRCHWTTTHLLE